MYKFYLRVKVLLLSSILLVCPGGIFQGVSRDFSRCENPAGLHGIRDTGKSRDTVEF